MLSRFGQNLRVLHRPFSISEKIVELKYAKVASIMGQFTKRQWLTLIVISIADFANAVCVSLQAPFYPQEVIRQTYIYYTKPEQHQEQCYK